MVYATARLETCAKQVYHTVRGQNASAVINRRLHKIQDTLLEQQRKEIAAQIADDNPLLLYRFYELHQHFKSKKHIGQSLTNHQQKINWHIHRIYHSRNMIVHSAESLPYLPTLVENLHLYLDTLIHAITRLAKNHNISDRRSIDVDTAVASLAAHEKFLIHNYTISNTNPDVECDLSNYWDLVFGSINPLAPTRP